MLVSCGLIIIARVSINKSFKQFVIVTACFALCIAMIYIFGKIKWFKKITWVYASVGLLMLSIVLVLGKISHGSKLSISLGPISVQPSEFVKILFIFFIASILWNEINYKKIALSALIAALYIGILVVSKDLGSALIYFMVYLFILVIATGNYLFMVGGLLAGAGASIVAYKIFSHVRVRVEIWRDPWPYIDNKGYQIIQSMFSITSGGFWGTGLLKGTPTTIPFADTDFVFSVICEEMGLIYAISILIIGISSFIEMLRVSSKINDNFYKQIVFGIAVSLLFQAFVTVGGGIKFIPLTGVTLPLISYGGSSIMSSTLMYFIVQAIYVRLRKEDKRNKNGKAK
ncbi:MAG: FtsW/RodA/SpoVE family cell cycle protein [Lachnospiraceae bacterium]|nr:FtsW/RodA/SpoVE family cell cycle protein [Lachnospiraceae bacterium]